MGKPRQMTVRLTYQQDMLLRRLAKLMEMTRSKAIVEMIEANARAMNLIDVPSSSSVGAEDLT